MERALTNYIRALRAAGAEVSPSEAIDAARALARVGYAERQTLKDSLSVVLAKTAEEKALHDRLFDLYFSRPEAAQQAGQPGDEGGERDEDRTSGADAGEGGNAADALLDLANANDANRMAVAMERAGAAAGADQIRFASQGPFLARRMLEAMGVEALEARLMERLQTRTPEAQAEAQALTDA